MAVSEVKRAAAIQEPSVRVPPLESGDHLSRDEFERRYDAMPHLKKAELIDGVVYVASPVRFRAHGRPHGQVIGWLTAYCAATPGVELADNTTVRLAERDEPQPDVLLRIEPAAGGRSHVSEDDYLEGPPELVVEVAGSSASIDRHQKLQVYERAGVQEYVLWSVFDRQLDWFALEEGGVYVPLPADERGIIHSRVLPGLVLAPGALLAGDLAALLAAQQAALGTPEHRRFVETLAAAQARH